MANVTELNDASFDGAVGKAGNVLIDFWAPWCGPCRALAQTIEGVAERYGGRVEVCKVNVDENPGLASKFRVMSIPTVVFFRGGEPVAKLTGLHPDDAYTALIEENMV